MIGIDCHRLKERTVAIDWSSAVGLVGQPCDERGEEAVAFVHSRTNKCCTLIYNPDSVALFLDGAKVECDELTNTLRSLGRAFVLEATTLGTTECVLATRGAKDLGISQLSFLYVEPMKYRRPTVEGVIHARDFELTREYNGFHAVPGFAHMLDLMTPQVVIFFLGFEGERLDQAFEQLPIDPRSASAVFGVPAFHPGWEVNSFANNMRCLRERGIGSSIYYCGANDPSTTVRLLERVYSEKDRESKLFVAPIGTKPQTLGLALFLADHRDVGFLYDHPIRGSKRSEGCGVWHVYNVRFI